MDDTYHVKLKTLQLSRATVSEFRML